MKLKDILNEGNDEKLPNNAKLKSIAKKEVDNFIKTLFKKYPEILNPTTPKDKRKVQDNFSTIISDEITSKIVAHINTIPIQRHKTPKEKEKSDKESADYYNSHDKYGNSNYDSKYAK
tara:strand:+ start:30 stop:383 length:354 start_codon:yes stop_codon:yes gene_type:complete